MRRLLILSLLAILSVVSASAQTSLYSDPRAAFEGDVITVVLAERTQAARQSDWDNRAQSRLGGSAAVSGDLAGSFALDAQFNKDALSRNQSSQRDLLTGTFTAQVIERDDRGNLVIAGERRLHVNGETHLLKVSGVVRPFDVRRDNSILSYQIANASIEYRHAGVHRRFIRPGFLARTGAVLLLGAAIVYASQN
ncbi:MAG: flagellar basal body L-ring protein FlgH [Bacteroidota bacterium]